MSNDKEYSFRWKNYEQNFPKRFYEFKEKKEFVDVTLIVENDLFGVHRLILSSISPYFYAMFSKSNQTCVKLDDISRRSLEYLIAYIYCGEVKVASWDLEDFLKAAKALDVQGIDGIDENSNLNNSKSVLSESEPNESIDLFSDRDDIFEAPNCESTVCDDNNDANSKNSHILNENVNLNDSSRTENVDDSYENANWAPNSNEPIPNDDEDEESYCTCECPCPDETNVDQSQNVCQNVTCPAGRFNDADVEADLACHPSKCARIDIPQAQKDEAYSSDFNIVADIHRNGLNVEKLYYDGYEFSKHNVSKSGVTYWQCICGKSKRCKARVHTKMLNGQMMMKTVQAEHTHPPTSLDRVFKSSDFNIVAFIRWNDQNLESLHHNGYTYWKQYVCNRITASSIRFIPYWICSNTKCKARAITKTVNDVVMAKLIGQEHNHERNTN